MENSKKPAVCLQRRAIVAGTVAAAGQALFAAPSFASTKKSASIGAGNFDADRFVEDCVIANQGSDAQQAVTEVLARAVENPRAIIAGLGEPKKAGLNVLLSSPALTIFAATWTPQMNLMPHNHLMWASIGIYTGREDNIFWKRTNDSIEAYAADALFEKDVASLPTDAMHSVTNPLLRFTGGLHIYGGDFFHTTRSQWDPETLAEEPSDGAVIRGIFERENERLGIHTEV